MSSSAGKVLLMPKGEYNSATTYYIYNVVYYETNNAKGLYVAKQTTTGVAPTDTTNWQILIDLTDYISTLDIATQQELGVIKTDGMTNEVSVTGVLKALGVGIVCTINPSGTEHGANWLKFGNTVITPDTRQMYRVNVEGKEFLFFWNGTQYIQLSGGGHTITTVVNGSILPMAGRAYLQFDNVRVEDDPTNDSTVIKPQIQICATEAEWNQMTDAEKNDPLVYWVRPWASSDAFASDRTPVGTVVSVGAAKTGEATGVSTPTGRFPTDDYLVCDGSTYITVDGKTVYICQQNFPKLYDYFVEAYGTATYFGSGRGQQGDFSLPDWTADFPENGILCIKAQISSTAITFAEVDDESVTEGNVWSAKKVSDYLYNMRRRVRKNITSTIQEDNGARLIAAIAEQDLAKYGFAIGDYFESPTARTLKQQSSNASTETNTSVKLRYHLADMNTYYGGYSSYAVISTPHTGIVVDTMVTRQWHTGDAASVGYNGSTLQAFLQGTSTGQVMTAIKADMIALFGGSTGLEHLLSHQKLFTNTFTGWAWQADKYISALTESEISGHTEWSGNPYQEGEAVKPLELFRKFRWNEIFGNNWIWLRNLYTASSACYANVTGYLNYGGVATTGRAAGLILFH